MGRIGGVAAGAVVVGVLLAGCGAGGSETASDSARSEQGTSGVANPQAPGVPRAGEPGAGQSGAGKEGAGKEGASSGGEGGQGQGLAGRAIVRTGALTVEGDDVSGMRQKAVGVVAGLGGVVASEDTGSDADGKVTRANLVVKVPGKAYESAIQRLSGLGTRLAIQQESTDVTEQVVDVGSRIASQRASLDRMRALMAKANTIGDIVSVESELTRRESDLEALLAKQKNLSLQTELATLTLTLTAKGKPPAQTEPKQDKGFVAGLKGGWHAFTAVFSALAKAVGAALPFLVLLAIIGVPLWRFRRRRPLTQPAAQQAEE
ncbi:DUF4349 domain-containing protein [Kribbella solani]|nr:DUF4349 domain-containing protein [Kribbella solani]